MRNNTQVKVNGIGSASVTTGDSHRMTFKQRQLVGAGDRMNELHKRFTHANHGVNIYMPFFTGHMSDFPKALYERAIKVGGQEIADELFSPEVGKCAFNHTNKMVFVPVDVSEKAKHTLKKMGVLTSILVCVRAGFLHEVLFNDPDKVVENRNRVGRLFQHMKSVHNADIFVVGYNDDRYLEKDNKRLWKFINDYRLRIARADRGRGLTTAVKNAKHELGRQVFSRTLYMDNTGNLPPHLQGPYRESGYDIARAAHAAPLISNSIFKCPKCFEPWYAPRQQYIEEEV